MDPSCPTELRFEEDRGAYRSAALWHSLAWVFLGLLSGGAIGQMGFVAKRIGGSPSLVTALTIGPRIIALFAFLYVPWLERRPATSLVSAMRALGCLLLLPIALVTSPLAFAAVGIAGIMALQMSETFYGRLLGQLYPPHLRGRLQVYPLVAFSMTAALASYGSGWLLDQRQLSYRHVLPAFALAGLVSAILVRRLPVRPHIGPSDSAGLWTCLKVGLHDRRFLLWSLLYSVTTIGFWVSYAAIPVYFDDSLQLTYGQNGLSLAVHQVSFCAAFFMWGRALDKYGAPTIMSASWMLCGIGLACMFLGQSYPSALLGQTLLGLGLAGNDISWYVVVLEFSPEDSIDRYMGLYMMFFGARALVAGVVVGTLMESNAQGSWIALGAASLAIIVGSLLMLTFRRYVSESRQ